MAITVPYIPNSITVHLGPPDSSAPNVTVPFTDYIKNVASSEVYPTWEDAALRANILAQISFALNRVYTEFYPSRGYDFDITNSTATDQKYINGRDIFENISDIVDELFNSYLRRPGFIEPLLASFCNGTTVTCEGMSQWGSQRLAQAGRSTEQILDTYYNPVETVSGAPVQAPTRSYPGTPLQIGSRGPDVITVQYSLNRIARNYPAIPLVPVDGVFGEQTAAAVRRFQEIFNLTPDGIVGSATWYALVRLFVAVTRLSELNAEGLSFTPGDLSYPGFVVDGGSGPPIRKLQYMLSVVGAFVDYLPILAIDGIFGPNTANAIRAFQRYVGLPITGTADRTTWDTLYRYYAGIVNGVLSDRALFSDTGSVPAAQEQAPPNSRMVQYPGFDLSRGSRDQEGVMV